MEALAIETVPFHVISAWEALDAYTRYGKGIHPAGLNLMDCVAYALSRQSSQPLLFKGNDFSRTDVASVL